VDFLIYTPVTFLRCGKCVGRTRHVLIKTFYAPGNEVAEETYECQECGETRKIYELAFVLGFPRSFKLTDPNTHFSK